MIEHIKIYWPFCVEVDKPLLELHTGAEGVSKMFFDEKDPRTLVVLTDAGIVTYSGFLFVCIKAYKKE